MQVSKHLLVLMCVTAGVVSGEPTTQCYRMRRSVIVEGEDQSTPQHELVHPRNASALSRAEPSHATPSDATPSRAEPRHASVLALELA